MKKPRQYTTENVVNCPSTNPARFDPEGHARFGWMGLYLLSSPAIERWKRLVFQERRK